MTIIRNLNDTDIEPADNEFCPNLPDMIHDLITNLHPLDLDDDPSITYATLADLVSKQVADILSWPEYVAFEGGGRVFIPIPESVWDITHRA